MKSWIWALLGLSVSTPLIFAPGQISASGADETSRDLIRHNTLHREPIKDISELTYKTLKPKLGDSLVFLPTGLEEDQKSVWSSEGDIQTSCFFKLNGLQSKDMKDTTGRPVPLHVSADEQYTVERDTTPFQNKQVSQVSDCAPIVNSHYPIWHRGGPELRTTLIGECKAEIGLGKKHAMTLPYSVTLRSTKVPERALTVYAYGKNYEESQKMLLTCLNDKFKFFNLWNETQLRKSGSDGGEPSMR